MREHFSMWNIGIGLAATFVYMIIAWVIGFDAVVMATTAFALYAFTVLWFNQRELLKEITKYREPEF